MAMETAELGECPMAKMQEISGLLGEIEQATDSMNSTFERTILKHEEQFLKSYRTKVFELSRLFQKLRRNIEDKFINNAITQQLDTIMRERDYFKYECLKLNTQYQNVLEDFRNLTEQSQNVSQQAAIYKHLLEAEKLKSRQTELNASKLKQNLTDLAAKTLLGNEDAQKPALDSNQEGRSLFEMDRQLQLLKKELREKKELVRALKEKVTHYDQSFADTKERKERHNELHEVFRCCVDSWKKEVLSKSKKMLSSASKLTNESLKHRLLSSTTVQQLHSTEKKTLLKLFFTNPSFLAFIEKLLFDEHFEVRFIEIPSNAEKRHEQSLIDKRNKLFDLMKQKGFVSSSSKPIKFRS